MQRTWQGERQRPVRQQGVTPDARRAQAAPPRLWADLLSREDWEQAVEVIGESRLDELHPLMTRVSSTFRSTFVSHLTDLAHVPSGPAVILAIARASQDAKHRAAEREALKVRGGLV
jgi:hypothetical protein